MERKSLDDILDDNNEPEVVEAQPEQQPEAQPRDEGGRFAQKGDEPETDAGTPPADEAEVGLLAAKQAEKQKRQAVERERDEFAAQLEALRKEIANQRPKEPPKPAPDMFGEPEDWQTHFAGQTVSQAVQQAAFENKLNTSEFYARKNIEGFDDAWPELNKWLSDNPAIVQQAVGDFDPWGFAWRQYNNQRTIQELGATDVASLEAKLREKIMSEMQAAAPVQAGIPTSLSTKRSVGSRSGPAWTGPTPLGDLIGN